MELFSFIPLIVLLLISRSATEFRIMNMINIMYATSLKNEIFPQIRHFPTNKIKKYMTRFLASLIIKGNADQKHNRYHLIPLEWLVPKCKK